MKKLLIFIVSLFSIFALASCGTSEPDYTLKKDYENKVLYEQYLNTIAYNDECIKVEGYNTKATRFDVYLPKDIKASTMYTKTNVEAQFNDKFYNMAVSYQSFSQIADANGGSYIRNILETKKADITSAYGDFKILDDAFTSWTHTVELSLEAQEGKERELVVLYLPVKVAYFTAKKDSDAVKTVETFVLVPVQLELTYNDSELTNFKDFKEFSFELENGLLK